MRLTYNAVDYGIIDSSVLVESGHFNHRLVLATKQKRDAFTILLIYTQLKAALHPMCALSNDHLQQYTFKLNTLGDLMAVKPTFPHILSLFKYLHSPQENPL